jgi:omega-amidase
MKINLVQYDPVWEDKEANKQKLNELLSNKIEKNSLVLLPEMTLTGFTMEAEKLAEKIHGETVHYFVDVALKYETNVLGGLIEKDRNNYFNTLVHINSKGKLVKIYRKMHPFSYSGEDIHYKRGGETIVTEIDDFKIGLSICYDLRFPELYRRYGKAGVHLIIVIANWPDTRIEHWRTLLKARAIENQCYVAGVNRVGNDPKLKYNGFSSVFDPMGKELIYKEDQEEVLTLDILRENVEEVRTKLPFLNDIYLI